MKNKRKKANKMLSNKEKKLGIPVYKSKQWILRKYMRKQKEYENKLTKQEKEELIKNRGKILTQEEKIKNQEKMQAKENEFMEAINEEKKLREADLSRMVKPHDKKSREVKESDIMRVVNESKILYNLCFTPSGLYQGAHAIHHSQIDDKDPLNFFVTVGREIIINPKFIRHSNYTVDSKEGCQSFADKKTTTVQRWHKCEVEYISLIQDKDDENKFLLSNPIRKNLSGFQSFVFQHEYDHGDAKYIYEINNK